MNHRIFCQSRLENALKDVSIIVFHVSNAPKSVGKWRLCSVQSRCHFQRVRWNWVTVRVIERIAQERNIAFLFIFTDVVLHAVCTLVPLCGSIARMFRQILFVNAVRTNQFQSGFFTFLCEHKLFAHSQHTSKCQTSHRSRQSRLVHIQTTHRFAHFLTGQTSTSVANILQNVFACHGVQFFVHFPRRMPHILAQTMPQTPAFRPYFM